MHQFLNVIMGIFSLTMMVDFVLVVYKGFRAEDICAIVDFSDFICRSDYY